MGQLEVSNECFKLMISPPLPNLFQVYDSDCCDSILLELREYLPKYFGVWSPPTAPNGTVLILSVNPNPLEKFSGDGFLAVASSAGFFLVLLCNPLTFPLTTGPICSLLAGLGPWDHPGESQALRECVRKGKWEVVPKGRCVPTGMCCWVSRGWVPSPCHVMQSSHFHRHLAGELSAWHPLLLVWMEQSSAILTLYHVLGVRKKKVSLQDSWKIFSSRETLMCLKQKHFSSALSYLRGGSGASATYRNKRRLSSLFKCMGTKMRCCAPLIYNSVFLCFCHLIIFQREMCVRRRCLNSAKRDARRIVVVPSTFLAQISLHTFIFGTNSNSSTGAVFFLPS